MNLHKLIRRLFSSIVVSVAVLWLMPEKAEAQIFVDEVGGTVGEYNLDGSTVNSSFVSGLQTSNGAFAVSGGQLFVDNIRNAHDVIDQYPIADGSGSAGPLIIYGGNLSSLSHLAVSGGQIFVSGVVELPNLSFTQAIGEYNIADGSAVNPLLITASDGGLYNAALAVSGGNLFVLNPGGQNVSGVLSEYNLDGTVVNSALIAVPGNPTSVHYGLTISSGHLFFTYSNGNGNAFSVGEYNIDGSVVNASLISMTNYTGGLAVGGGHILVGEVSGVAEYNLDGSLVNANFIPTSNSPNGVAFGEIPEPSTYAMLAGLVVLGVAMLRRQQNVKLG